MLKLYIWQTIKNQHQAYRKRLDKLNKINGVTYDWVDDITTEYSFHPQCMHEHGVVAQEIAEVLPDAVVTAPFNGSYTEKCGTDHDFKTVHKEKIIPLLIEAIKELQQESKNLGETWWNEDLPDGVLADQDALDASTDWSHLTFAVA